MKITFIYFINQVYQRVKLWIIANISKSFKILDILDIKIIVHPTVRLYVSIYFNNINKLLCIILL